MTRKNSYDADKPSARTTLMSTWTIAAVQMDCRLGALPENLRRVRQLLGEAAARGARLVVFPECVLSGYCFTSKAEALPHAEPLPGPACDAIVEDCARLGVFAVIGLLELDGERIFNACLLAGPSGLVATYRKIHLPFLGVDRFTTPGDRPFAVQDLGGLRVGMNICYDGSFPESARCLTLLGADLVVLPTNWPTGALSTVRLTEARALENHVYAAAVNRVGEERGFRFIGRSRLVGFYGEILAEAPPEGEHILTAVIDPEAARRKRDVKVPGEHEVDRVGDRRPEMYGPLTASRRS
jgi:predicted amidohydrolase